MMKKNATIVCYGDSNTFGYDPRGLMGYRYPKNQRWVDLLSNYGYKGINEGQNGREFPTDRFGYGSLQTILKRNQKADFLIIMLGANDLLRLRPASEMALVKRVKDMFLAVPMLQEFRQSAKGILMIASPPLLEAPYGREDILNASMRWGDALEMFCKKEALHFVDSKYWDIELAFDGDHFSAKGHEKFAKCLSSYLDQLSMD